MAVATGVTGPVTVDDVWVLHGDPAALSRAARSCRRLAGRWSPAGAVADELAVAAEVLVRGQRLLGAVLDRLDMAVSWQGDGTLTFFPHDAADVRALDAALEAAAVVHAHVEDALDRHRQAIATLLT